MVGRGSIVLSKVSNNLVSVGDENGCYKINVLLLCVSFNHCFTFGLFTL